MAYTINYLSLFIEQYHNSKQKNMKKLFSFITLLLATALMATSCNCFKKMAKEPEAIKVTCTPEVLVLNNGKVAATINATVPAKYFNKKASVRVTPVLVYATGYTKGETIVLQGEKVVDNGIVVKRAEEMTIDRTIEFKYKPEMSKSVLKLLVEVKCKKGKCKTFTYINANTGDLLSENQQKLIQGTDAVALQLISDCGRTVARGINTLQQDIDYASSMQNVGNNYKNVTTEIVKADIAYKVNSAKVEKNAMGDDMTALKENVAKNNDNKKATQALYVKGYASPEGPEKLNNELSEKRSQSGTEALEKFLGDTGLKIDAASYGEDWEGFQEAVAKSDIQDKDLILQVLQMYSSSSDREKEIKNMSAVYKNLTTDVLPMLRRAQVVNSADIEGKSDSEMIEYIKAGKANELTAEELLHIAEANPEVAEQALTAAAEQYNDARAWNNLAVVQAQNGDFDAAEKSLKKAAEAGASKDALNTNFALTYLGQGNVEKAEEYAAAASNDTKALLNAAKGKYTEAEGELTGYNAAIAQVQQGKYAEALKSLQGDNSAQADYLRAVIANKEGNFNTAKSKLASAVEKDASLAEKALNDANLEGVADSVKSQAEAASKQANAAADNAKKDASDISSIFK